MEPIYKYVKGEGWVITTFNPKAIFRGDRSLDDMDMKDVCPRCEFTWGQHWDWSCPNVKNGKRSGHGPLEWPKTPEDL